MMTTCQCLRPLLFWFFIVIVGILSVSDCFLGFVHSFEASSSPPLDIDVPNDLSLSSPSMVDVGVIGVEEQQQHDRNGDDLQQQEHVRRHSHRFQINVRFRTNASASCLRQSMCVVQVVRSSAQTQDDDTATQNITLKRDNVVSVNGTVPKACAQPSTMEDKDIKQTSCSAFPTMEVRCSNTCEVVEDVTQHYKHALAHLLASMPPTVVTSSSSKYPAVANVRLPTVLVRECKQQGVSTTAADTIATAASPKHFALFVVVASPTLAMARRAILHLIAPKKDM